MADLTPDQKHYVDRMSRHLEECQTRAFYSIQRFDLLAVSVSGAGLYLSLESLKFIVEKNLDICPCLLKFGGGMFAIAIFANFLSQLAAHKANNCEYGWASLEYDDAIAGVDDPNEPDPNAPKTIADKSAKHYNRLTHRINVATVVFMALGFFLLAHFYVIAF